VIYAHDGHRSFWVADGYNSWSMQQTLTHLTAQDLVHPIIVVAIHPISREEEYTHEIWSSESRGGGLAHYAEYMLKVKAFFDKNYRTISDSKSTGIVGSSLGGLASFYIAGAFPQAFGLVGAMSPSLWVGWLPELDYQEWSLMQIVAATLENKSIRPRIHLSYGKITDEDETAIVVSSREMIRIFFIAKLQI